MNDQLLQDLANPIFDLNQATILAERAGHEIVRLENRIKELNAYNHRLQNEIEKLSLDLGCKEYGYFNSNK